jgi:putative addiction module component (TIGR02574 family)
VTTSLQAIEAAAMQLSAEDRAELIERLIVTLPPPLPLHPAWETEIGRRVAELDAGLVACIPAEQVFAEMRAKFEKHKPKA